MGLERGDVLRVFALLQAACKRYYLRSICRIFCSETAKICNCSQNLLPVMETDVALGSTPVICWFCVAFFISGRVCLTVL